MKYIDYRIMDMVRVTEHLAQEWEWKHGKWKEDVKENRGSWLIKSNSNLFLDRISSRNKVKSTFYVFHVLRGAWKVGSAELIL